LKKQIAIDGEKSQSANVSAHARIIIRRTSVPNEYITLTIQLENLPISRLKRWLEQALKLLAKHLSCWRCWTHAHKHTRGTIN